MKPFAGMRNDRGLAAYAPGRSSMKIGSYAALVAEKYDGMLLLRQCSQLGKIALHPSLYQRRILLKRSAQRLLTAQPHLSEFDAVLASDQRMDHRPRPQRK